MKTIALFGGMGNTGRAFKKFALDNGYKIRMLVRRIENEADLNSNLVIIPGDFSEYKTINETVTGSDIVVCMGSALKSKEGRLMSNFVNLLGKAMKEHGVKKLLYQAGALNYLPNKKKKTSVWLMRNTIGQFSGAIPALLDHERAFAIIEQQLKQNGIEVMVTLPGAMGLEQGESKKELTVQEDIAWTTSRFVDVAQFSVKAIEIDKYWNQYIYIS